MQSITVLDLLLKVHHWQGGTIWQAFRELKPEQKQTIIDLAFSEKAIYNVREESALYKDLMEFIK